MSTYIPTTWTDEVPSVSPIRFRIRDSAGNIVYDDATIELVTSVTPGTPVNATNLNHLENGLETAQNEVTAVQAQANLGAPKIFTAKGDLIVATGNNAAARVAVGANGDILIPDSSLTAGVKWVKPVNYVGSPWGNTNWDGDAKSTGATSFNINDFNVNVPNAAKMACFRLVASWAGTGATEYVSITPYGNFGYWLVAHAPYQTLFGASAWIPLTNGQFTINIAGLANPTGVTVEILGYIL